jgi:DNA-binding response OmpR family regulator
MTKILIADDDPNILLSLEFLMKKEGYRVFIARDGAEALALIQTECPDVLLLDVMMPHMDGYQLAEFVRRTPEYNHLKIIFLSAKSKTSDIERGYAAGADLYIPKPFSTRELVSQVRGLVA